MSQPGEGSVAVPPDTPPAALRGSDGTVAVVEPGTAALHLAPSPPLPATRRERLDLVIPALLAALGLAAAMIAWRASTAASAAEDAALAGLAAARQRATSVIVGEGLTARTMEAYLDYERARRRAEILAAGGNDPDAQRARMEATSHWFLVVPEYLDRTGAFLPDRQRAALLAADEARLDINPDAHFETANAEQARIRGLLLAGIVLALALPFLTLAEVGRGALRAVGVIAGSIVFGAGLVLAAVAWV